MPRKLVLLFGLVMAVGALAIACSDDDDNAEDAAGPDHVGVLAALATLDVARLHLVEGDLIGDDPAIDPAWLGPLRNARTAVALIDWPEELEAAAQDFLDDSMPLLMALEADDLEAAAQTASDAHVSWHLLKDPGYAYLAVQAGTGSASDAEHEHEAGDDANADHDDS